DLKAAREVLAGALYRVDATAADEVAGGSGFPRVNCGAGASANAPGTHRYRRSGSLPVRVTVRNRVSNTANLSRPVRVVEHRLAGRYRGRQDRISPSGRVLSTSAAVAQPRRAVAAALRMLSRARSEWASVEQPTGTPASTASRTCASGRSIRSGRPLISTALP